jgi:hypothetical protein
MKVEIGQLAIEEVAIVIISSNVHYVSLLMIVLGAGGLHDEISRARSTVWVGISTSKFHDGQRAFPIKPTRLLSVPCLRICPPCLTFIFNCP